MGAPNLSHTCEVEMNTAPAAPVRQRAATGGRGGYRSDAEFARLLVLRREGAPPRSMVHRARGSLREGATRRPTLRGRCEEPVEIVQWRLHGAAAAAGRRVGARPRFL